MPHLTTQNYDLVNQNFQIDEFPNECPYCHRIIHPRIDRSAYNSQNEILEVLFFCTHYRCNRFFLAFYTREGQSSSNFNLKYLMFGNPISQEFSDIIKQISPSFIKIYNESYFSEQHNLKEICGAGYRKSIEFLIKDYLIKKDETKSDEIKKKYLGNCINDYVTNANIKIVVSRATWLGNDETHYMRKWEDQDLTNLKDLIRLTINWIEDETLTEKYKIDMPEK